MPSDPFAPSPRAPGEPPRGLPPRRPDPVVLVWIGGIVLAAIAYAVGPEHFLGTVLLALSHVGDYVDDLVHNLTAATFNVMRAAAIGLYGTFAALSAIAIGRGERGRFALLVITVVFLLLVWDAWGESPSANGRWLAALVVAGVSALSVTRRLTRFDLRR